MPMPANSTFAPGSIIKGQYRIERRLGSGGMGIVYVVKDIHLDQEYALKVLKGDASDENLMERFRYEARIAARLVDRASTEEGRDHVLPVLHYGVLADGRPFVIMPLLRAISLKEYLAKKGGRLSQAEACEFAYQLALAVCFLHDRQIVHRDIKPQNIMVEPHGAALRVIVVDYGLAKCLAAGAPVITEAGGAVGTPGFAPLEQVRGAQATFSMDVFAAAMVTYLMLTGVSPWEEYGEAAVAVMTSFDAPKGRTYLETLDRHGDLEWKISAALERCLSHTPERRDDAYTLRACFDKVRKEALKREAGQPVPMVNSTAVDGVSLVSSTVEQRELALAGAPTDRQRKQSSPTEREGGDGWKPFPQQPPVDDSAVTNVPPQKTKRLPRQAPGPEKAPAATNATPAPTVEESRPVANTRTAFARMMPMWAAATCVVVCLLAVVSFYRKRGSAQAEPPSASVPMASAAVLAPLSSVTTSPAVQPASMISSVVTQPAAVEEPAPATRAPELPSATAPTRRPTPRPAPRPKTNVHTNELESTID